VLIPAIPENEADRARTLHLLEILDSEPEERFDRLTRLARSVFGVPIALVSLVDSNRQWFKSKAGLDATETPREISFCGHAILADEIFAIRDALADERFRDNPLVTDEPRIRFYAGCPLKAVNGALLGTLCLIDRNPREFDDHNATVLRDLAGMAEKELAAVQLATLDELTGLSNRRGFTTLAAHTLAMCQRLSKPASLLYLDLDHFKAINDNHGHAEGDRVLVAFAELLRQTFRESDVVARLGGDEFAVLLTDSCSQTVTIALQRFADAVAAHNARSPQDYDIEYSVGAVSYDTQRHPSMGALMEEADTLMYRNKRKHHRDDAAA
jgi:diguanylate cyclase (GGDEF)-like protein